MRISDWSSDVCSSYLIGLRLDDYSTDSVGRNNRGAFDLTNNSRFLNPQVGLVYKPLPNGSIYVAYSTSSKPSGGSAGEGGGEGSLGVTRSERRRVGKGLVSTLRDRGGRDNEKKK